MYKPEMTGYAIFDPTTGKWSQGGISKTTFKNTPKVWHQFGHLKNHLNMFVNVRYTPKRIDVSSYYRGCYVVDMESMKPFAEFDIYDYLYLQVSKFKNRFDVYQSFPVYEV
jgi:hypothetical protein